MNDVLTYVALGAGFVLAYGLLIIGVSYLVHFLQAQSDLPEGNETWEKDGTDGSGVLSQSSENGMSDAIPVASVADELPEAEVGLEANSQLDWSGNYVPPSSDIIMAYENLSSVDYPAIGFGKGMLISLVTIALATVCVGVLLALYSAISFAFRLPTRADTLLVVGIVFLAFFSTALLLRLSFQKATFGPTSLAVAIETILVVSVVWLLSLSI